MIQQKEMSELQTDGAQQSLFWYSKRRCLNYRLTVLSSHFCLLNPCLSVQTVDSSWHTHDVNLEIVRYSVPTFLCTLASFLQRLWLSFGTTAASRAPECFRSDLASSGLWGGHSDRRTLLSQSRCLVHPAVCVGSLSCCSHQSLWYQTCAVGRRKHCRMSTNSSFVGMIKQKIHYIRVPEYNEHRL